MNLGNLIIRIAFGLLFIWGGLEKFFEGFLGGAGLQNMAGFLKSTGWSFLGDTGVFILAIILASLELLAGILLISNKKLFYSYSFLSFVMFVALTTVHIPSANWMNIMIHIALLGSLLGLALDQFKKEKPLWEQ
ncbi:DoxX family protein [Flavobacterium columnare]|uniref:DoxX family protein n=1 Tax=Flavobacterium columnare TaxID=996 RepID=A0AAI8CGL1_9FLAO|nr:DoxX family protein [Flavobacterium columnare]AMO19796.1 DoxX family protein [Flavobacterium columnare]AUX17727.1 doxX family protein [Flavobacterium columnare]QOG56790.1 DoxX family protein [Flavobacterium columnare]QOG59515.1 DoxX family protein [Flavobacterium columnare]QOG62235.1 DoxX family protein [Flavobacterium columnare]